MVKLKWRQHVHTGSVNRKDVALESTKSLASNIATKKSPDMAELVAKHVNRFLHGFSS